MFAGRSGVAGGVAVAVVLGLSVAPAYAAPVSVTAPAVQDCTLGKNFIGTCADSTVVVGQAKQFGRPDSFATEARRGLFQFDLSGVPAGAEVLSASLRLRVVFRPTSVALPVEVRPLTNRWSNAATWTDYDTFLPWVAPGADVGAVVATGTIGASQQFYRFDVAPLVRDWVGGVRPNYGLRVGRTSESDLTPEDRASISSAEATGAEAQYRPVLEITYEPGTPPSATLSGSLWDERDVELSDDRSDAGYITADEGLQVTAAEGAPGAGIASVEMLVDGQRLRAAHLVTPCAPTCPASTTTGFTMYRADVAAGDHEIRVVVRDRQAAATSTVPGAHTTVRAFNVTFGDPVTVPDDDTDDEPLPGEPAVGRAFAAPATAPLLTAAAATDTKSLIAAQAAKPQSDLSRLLNGAPYTVDEVGVMSQGADASGRPDVVGTVAIVHLAQPIAVRATVRCYRARPDTPKPVFYNARIVARSLRNLLVRMDPETGTILCASPGPGSDADMTAVDPQIELPRPSHD